MFTDDLAAAGGGYPNDDAKCMHSGQIEGACDNYDWGYLQGNGTWKLNSSRGFGYRNCTDFAAFKAGVSWSSFGFPAGKGSAKDWKDYATRAGFVVNDTAAVGDIAWWPANSSGFGLFGHVAIVTMVNTDSSVDIEEYNGNGMGLYGTRTNMHATKYLHKQPAGGTVAAVIAVKRTSDPAGVRQVYAATSTAVTEGWWIPGGSGVHTAEIIHIAQGDISGFDKINLPDGTQAVYTAVSDGVWETWWRPGAGGSNKIVEGLAGTRGVIATQTVEAGQLVHHLYILAADGPYEAWWVDGGDGVHVGRLAQISGGTTFTFATAPDGTNQLYVATPTWVYEMSWVPHGTISTRTIINITQADIRLVYKGSNLPDGGQLLYTLTSNASWQTYWNGPSVPSHGTITSGHNDLRYMKKTVTGDSHQLYVTSGADVREYWWTPTSSGNGTLITISQNNIAAFDKVNDGAVQQLYTAAGNTIWETWWGGGTSPTSTVLYQVAR